MKKNILRSMRWLILLTLVLLAVLLFSVFYVQLDQNMKENVKQEAQLIAKILETVDSSVLETLSNQDSANRITLIRADGIVKYDNEFSENRLDNHKDRPEVAQALTTGVGENLRYSSSLQEQTYYYALRLKNNAVLRLSNTQTSIFARLLRLAPLAIVLVILVFLSTSFVAERMTRRIVNPINKIDPNFPENAEIYDELLPLLSQMVKQKRTIAEDIRRLNQKQQEFSLIVARMNEGLVLLDNKANILTFNPSAAKLIGVSDSDLTGRPFLSVNRNLQLMEVVQSARCGEFCEVVLTITEKTVSVNSSPIFDDQQNLTGIALMVFDVTEKQMAEKMRREFSANVSHELKTPLQSILGYAELLRGGIAKMSDAPEFADKIICEASRMGCLIDDIMKLSRLDENQALMPWEEVDLLTLSHEIVGRFRKLAKNADVNLFVSGQPAFVCGVRQILDEMIDNLVHNAIQYNRNGGEVRINVEILPCGTQLSVMDSGIGIAEEEQMRVFERFYRVDKSHSKLTGGTGLGLSIVKNGAAFHHAQVELDSKIGVGTTIRLIFKEED